jgi:hypothetical protein
MLKYGSLEHCGLINYFKHAANKITIDSVSHHIQGILTTPEKIRSMCRNGMFYGSSDPPISQHSSPTKKIVSIDEDKNRFLDSFILIIRTNIIGHSLIHSKPLFIKEEKGLIETYNHHHHHNRHPMSFLPVDNNTLLNYASRGLNNNHNSSPSSPGGQEGQLRHAGTSSGPASDINNGTGMLMAGYHHHHHATAAASPYYPHPYSHAHHLSMSSHHHHQRLVGVNSAAFQDFPTSAMSHHQQCTPAEGHHHPHLLPPLTAINDYSSLYTMEHHHHYHASSHRQYGGGGSNSVATFPQTSYNNGTGGGSAIGFGVSSGHANNQSNGIVSSKGANSINEGGNGSKSGRTYDLRNHQIHQNKSGGDGGVATNCGLGNDGGMAIGYRS